MAEKIVGGKADGEQIGDRAGAEFFAGNQSASKLQLVIVCQGCRTNYFKEFGARLARGGEQHVAATVLDFLVPVLIRRLALVELLHPGGQLVAIVAGGDPGAAALL